MTPAAVIMAGGRGQRLRPLTDKVPKPLLRIGATSIIERIIAGLAGAGVEEVYLAVNYKAEAFEERLGDGEHLGVRLRYLHERIRLGTAGPLSLLPERPPGAVLVMNADIMTRLDFRALFSFHEEQEGAATVAAVRYTAAIPYAVLKAEGSRLVGISEKPGQEVLCNAGIYMLEPAVLDLVPADVMLDMPDLLEKIMAEGHRVNVFPFSEKWFDIGSPDDFDRVLHEFATGEEE